MLAMPLELTQSLFLLGLLALPVVVWYFYRGLTDFAKWGGGGSVGGRAVVIALLVLAVAGLTWMKPSKEQFVVFAIDESLSVGDEARSEVRSFLERASASAGPNKIAFVRFGAEPG